MAMNYGQLAFCHPGKIGDALYTLPTIRSACLARALMVGDLNRRDADFYTSSHCAPLKRLFEYQPFIRNFIIPPEYEICSMDLGVQPWKMPVDEEANYHHVFQLGFQNHPDRALPDYIALQAGVVLVKPLELQCPDIETLAGPYIILASRHPTSYDLLFQQFIELCPYPVVQIGSKGQFLESVSIDRTGLDMLETASWIKKSAGFVGMMSSQLVLANAFPIPKVAPHDGIHWDMRHVMQGPLNHYPILPSAGQVAELLGLHKLGPAETCRCGARLQDGICQNYGHE